VCHPRLLLPPGWVRDLLYAKSRGLSIAYSVLGDGPLDLVAVPGFVSHVEAAFEQPALARAMRRLASFAHVIAFDKPGTGLSDPVVGSPTHPASSTNRRAPTFGSPMAQRRLDILH